MKIHLGFSQKIVLNKLEKSIELTDNQYVYKDFSEEINIDSIAKFAKFEKSNKAIPDFGWSNKRGWLRFSMVSVINQNLVIQINNPIFYELDFFLFKNEKLVSHKQKSKKSRLPNFEFSADKNQLYTIFIAGKSKLNPLKFPISISSEKIAIEKEVFDYGKTGFVVGLLSILILLNLLINYFFKIRLFGYLAFNGFSFVVLYLFLNGYLYKAIGIQIFDNQTINFKYIIYSAYLIINLAFPWAMFKIAVLQEKKWRLSYQILLTWSILLSIIFIFFEKWLLTFSEGSIQILNIILRTTALANQIFVIAISLKVFKKLRLGIWFLAAILPGMLSFTVPRFFSQLISDKWITQSDLIVWALIWYIIVLSIGFVLYLSENYITKNNPENSRVENQENTELRNNKPITNQQPIPNSPLSKRETEILQAYSNCFSYQEISDAFFISPHTVRTHIKNIYQKLSLNSKAEAVRWVMEQE